jgi:hypothetical protein
VDAIGLYGIDLKADGRKALQHSTAFKSREGIATRLLVISKAHQVSSWGDGSIISVVAKE